MQSLIRCVLVVSWLVPATACADGPIIPPEAGLPVIDWKDARKYLDREVIVQGQIVDARNIGKICFLNFDRARSFTAVVHGRDYEHFPKSPEYLYGGKILRVRGVISEYKNKLQIEILRPEQVTILDKPEPIPPAPPEKPDVFNGVVTLATYNVLNLFDEYDDPYHTDEGTVAKPREQLEKLAATIRKIDADVLALEEVENRDYLERFVRAMLPGMGYKHVVCIESNDRRGIDCAVLSRLPVGPVTSYRHLRFSDGSGGTLSFRRDLLRVRIEPPAAPAFDVFVIHLKSKRGGKASDRVRRAEARAARRVLDGLLARDADARFVICGDFNDTLDSDALKALRGEGETQLKTFVDELPDGAMTFNRKPYQSVIDFILCSPAMAKLHVPKSYRVVAGTVKSSGSDHNPVLVQFDMRSR